MKILAITIESGRRGDLPHRLDWSNSWLDDRRPVYLQLALPNVVIAGKTAGSDESVRAVYLDEFAVAAIRLGLEGRLHAVLPDHYILGLEDEFPAL